MTRFDETTTLTLRRGIMKRGQAIATALSDLMSGKTSEAAVRRLVSPKPGIRPEEALRMALDALEARRKLLDAGDDRFGRCDVCNADLGIAALGELPWADRCQAHAAD